MNVEQLNDAETNIDKEFGFGTAKSVINLYQNIGAHKGAGAIYNVMCKDHPSIGEFIEAWEKCNDSRRV